MADIESTIILTPTESPALSTISMDHEDSLTDASLGTAIDKSPQTQQVNPTASSASFSTISMDHTDSLTDTSLGTVIDTSFETIIVFDIILTPTEAASLNLFDAGGIPIIFFERTSPEPIIFFERTSPEPIVFYARGNTIRSESIIERRLKTHLHFSFETQRPVISEAAAFSLISMNHEDSLTETALTTTFSTAVA